MQLIVFGAYIIFLIIYISTILAIVWQVKKYLLPNDASRWVLRTFIIGSIILIIVSLILFFLIPWEEMSFGI